MNLISCEKCGVILDANRFDLNFDGEIDYSTGMYKCESVYSHKRMDYIRAIVCPVCKTIISPEDGDIAE